MIWYGMNEMMGNIWEHWRQSSDSRSRIQHIGTVTHCGMDGPPSSLICVQGSLDEVTFWCKSRNSHNPYENGGFISRNGSWMKVGEYDGGMWVQQSTLRQRAWISCCRSLDWQTLQGQERTRRVLRSRAGVYWAQGGYRRKWQQPASANIQQ